MYQLSSQEFWAHFFTDFRCGSCGSDAGYASRPRNFFERYLIPLFLMKTVRCGDCYRRSLRPVNIQVQPRRENINADHVRAATWLVQEVADDTRKEPQKEIHSPADDHQRIA